MNASDVHITVGLEPTARINGKLIKLNDQPVTEVEAIAYVKQVLREGDFQTFERKGEVDCSYFVRDISRFRVNAYRQRGTCALAFRVIMSVIPTMEQLNLPLLLKDLSTKQRGLILVTGPTGSGKSTTLAAMLDHMNRTSSRHIITIEDPIEYLHQHRESMLNQREVGADTLNFANALRAALREDPDVILVGEMRDLETISVALTAAETGHLVLSTLHTIGAAKTIDRVIDAFPPEQQQQIKVQLASVIEAVISQQIMPRVDKTGRIPALEIMLATPAIRNLIREGKIYQIQNMLQTGAEAGMQTMDNHLLSLFRAGAIDMNTLNQYAVDLNFIHAQVGYL